MNFSFKIWLGCSQLLAYFKHHFPVEKRKLPKPLNFLKKPAFLISTQGSADLCRSLRGAFALAVSSRIIFAFVSSADRYNNADFFDKFQRFMKATCRNCDGSFYSLSSFSPRELKHSSTACSETSDRVEGFHFGLWSLSIKTVSREENKSVSYALTLFWGCKLVRWVEVAMNVIQVKAL